MRHFSSLLLLTISLIAITHAVEQDNAEFLFENAKICGDPFADPIWIPTLDLCTIECDQNTEYCVENEELQQQCKKNSVSAYKQPKLVPREIEHFRFIRANQSGALSSTTASFQCQKNVSNYFKRQRKSPFDSLSHLL